MGNDIRIDGRVVRLVSDDELIVSLGSSDGVKVDEILEVLDESAMNLTHPQTGQDLGGIKRVLTAVRIVDVAEHVSIATVHPKRTSISDMSNFLSGGSRPRRTLSKGWPEGVERGDPVMRVGRVIRRQVGSGDKDS